MGFVKEFKEFALKGNVVDLAVAFIIGAAFKKIVSSLVEDVIMPPIGLAVGGVSFDQLYTALDGKTYENLATAIKAGAPIIKYGIFIQTVIDFIIVAFVVFLMVKMINRMQELRKKREEDPASPVSPPEDILLLREIRDSLNKS